jgi:RNA polymerase sigma factor (sigma-70 family)
MDWPDLISRYYDGDDNAFEEIFNYWFPRLASHTRLSGMSSEDAQDIAAETLLKVSGTRYKNRYDPVRGAAFSTWVFRIALNVRLDLLKLRGRRPKITTADGSGREGENWLDNLPGALEDPYEASAYRNLSDAFEDCMSRIDLAHREAFVLAELQGFTLNEVVDAIGGSVPNIHRWVKKVRISLQECLGSKGYAQEATA